MRERLTVDWVVVGLLLAASVLLLSNLGNGYLWQDEAETAVLARTTRQYGYPRAFDGRSYLEIPAAYGHGPGEAWIYSPWLPFYLLAGVFAVMGESTAVARLPFALCGLLTLYLTWRLAAQMTRDRLVHRLSVAILTCSVPFLLHMRQCRYYALTTALVVGVCLAYLAWLRRPSARSCAWLIGALVAFFHTNFGSYVPLVIGLGLHCSFQRRSAPVPWAQVAWLAGIVGVLTVPWAMFFYRGAFIGALSVGRMFHHLEFYVRVINKYLVPLAFIGGAALVIALLRLVWPKLRMPQRSVLAQASLLALVIVAQAAFLLIPDQRQMRYLIPVVPLMAILEAWWLVQQVRWHRVVGWMIVGLVLFTNALQAPRVQIPLTQLVYELTHPYIGPMEGIVGYLRAHARPGETVKIPYDDRTLMFYTNLVIERPSEFTQESEPDWVILRRDWMPEGFLESPYFRRIAASYERIELPVPDVLWQNREDPGSHHFATVQDAPHVVIYRKRLVEQG